MVRVDGEELAACRPGLVRYALALTGDPTRAEDLVQDVLLRALERAGTFRGDSSLATWLHTIMHHRFIDLTRARRVDPVPDEELLERVEAAWRDDRYTVDADEVIARAQRRDDLMDALTHLPAILRGTVVRHDLEGLTAAEIAAVEGVSLSAVKQRLRRGRQALVSVLADNAARRAALTGVPMRCWKARSRVDDYLDGVLSDNQRVALERHLATCPTCPGLYAGIVGVTKALGALRDPDSVVPAAVAERLRAAKRPGQP